MRLSEAPGLLYPLLGSPAVLGTGLSQAPIYVGGGGAHVEVRGSPCLPQLLSTILLLLFFVNF